MRVGLLGLGRIGAFHAATLAAHPLVDELIVADPVRTSPHGRPGDPFDADAVVIATPTSTHAELLIEACRRGVPAFCEKPAAVGVKETLEVLAADRDGRVRIGFQRRFDAGYVSAAAALRAGELGELHRVHVITADPAPPPAAYIPLSGGIYRDCHIHDFDILRWVTGREVDWVYAAGANRGAAFFREAGDVDNSAALLGLDDGTLVTLQGSRYNGAGYDVRMELAGTRGTQVVGLGPRAPMRSTEGLQPPGEPWPDFVTRFRQAYVDEIDGFLRGDPRLCSVEEALAALHVAEAAELSRREGRPVQVAEVRA
ncbi:Gfo/Idh/MocA family protein [Nonomuraea muscovyensis]|uniref:Myo-inositol 2-dehydrogenase/D-chiro-inositol 1-dehydrogenase n=1 Tax=Nonomuraea muscovyensis TaxID=1124761 RepID=A0A7X0BYG4_9ACTN|nr:Gfo/Idh/MocA family oxidoreductase [Nonomuraea muscovyensis]MBB6344983.1 myo-inositol 2-dehydrogenase/D-chiro-inositol 1-dehydrogenase [Nonomuraea muscovyensis]